LLVEHANERPYPATILFDLTDFALGCGWIGYLLVIFHVLQKLHRQHPRLVMLAMAQIMVVAVTGLLQSETARVWNFMLPLLLIPVGLELSRWPVGARLLCYAALALITTVIYQKMVFIY